MNGNIDFTWAGEGTINAIRVYLVVTPETIIMHWPKNTNIIPVGGKLKLGNVLFNRKGGLETEEMLYFPENDDYLGLGDVWHIKWNQPEDKIEHKTSRTSIARFWKEFKKYNPKMEGLTPKSGPPIRMEDILNKRPT